MQKPDSELLQEWMSRVDDDLIAIQALVEARNFNGNAAGFHAQQASEKMLKTVLLMHGVRPPYIHSLKGLYALIGPDFPLRKPLSELLIFENLYLDSRCPSEYGKRKAPTREDAENWYGQLSAMRNELLNIIQQSSGKCK